MTILRGGIIVLMIKRILAALVGLSLTSFVFAQSSLLETDLRILLARIKQSGFTAKKPPDTFHGRFPTIV